MKNQKKIFVLIGSIFACCLTACGNNCNYPNIVGTPTDYSKGENWMVKQDNGDQKVDVFYLYPTSSNSKYTELLNPIEPVMKSLAYVAYDRGASCLDEFTNVFAPYYRQITNAQISRCANGEDFSNTIYNSEVRTDAYAALDYYFKNYNKGRPFILASHSQGSFTMRHILGEYMSFHKDYYSRMICAYTIGTCYNDEYLAKYPHIKMASGETDYGVTLTWNSYSESPTIDPSCFLNFGTNPYCINPLNWKLDNTYADISSNKGTFNITTHLVENGATDAQIDVSKHALVCKKAPENGYDHLPNNLFGKIFGTNSIHFDDWNLFYKNIQENAQKRIDSYFADHK